MKIEQQFPEIDTIIFDLGNVIINLDLDATNNAFKLLLGKNFESVMTSLKAKNIFQEYEKGNISTDHFIQSIAETAEISDEQSIKNAWNAMLLDIPEKRFELLEMAKKKYQTFCLSNTNELHIEFINNQLIQTKGIPNLNNYFEKVYLSHEMGMRKPDDEIFLKVQKNHNLNPSNTLFIDDTIGHLEGAKKIGLKTFHMTDGLSLEQLF